MSVRVNQRWPDGLKERVEAEVGKQNVTAFTVASVEKCLDPETLAPTKMASDRAVEVGLRLHRERQKKARPPISDSKLRKFG